ncbi:hypothetical protein KI387_001075, partial [Taxus chinensis]
ASINHRFVDGAQGLYTKKTMKGSHAIHSHISTSPDGTVAPLASCCNDTRELAILKPFL